MQGRLLRVAPASTRSYRRFLIFASDIAAGRVGSLPPRTPERTKPGTRPGFVVLLDGSRDDERLKNPPVANSAVPDRFNELLDRIRDIRASERRMYLRVREIFAMAADYSPSLSETTQFFRFIQNKLHFAVTGKTAAELIAERADSNRPNMGLTTWKSGRVQKADITVAKNYLHEPEIDELNRIVTMWLDFAEDQARRAFDTQCIPPNRRRIQADRSSAGLRAAHRQHHALLRVGLARSAVVILSRDPTRH
uniref:Putative virulence RhuM family protein n=1 Tax=Pseudomonas aeruginosa TaxID=287 RepID=A0A7L9E7A2_PSEAI|nr:putative virulence RhuM family protein [Pseudomonas aeruginosa]QOJ63161.1 putative virulence RhuM family protein [Pseudomonas aeruginosa]QOJ64262.1 putative virulence RhuM family protein [Pseudomonas aeruginosa]QOJ64768.1 putative virulence RhuM family protein [Pseudomonas aeruginosa]QOJ65357.1 putative virulence RhuM family protein [Pseudomonas aeruginosa]